VVENIFLGAEHGNNLKNTKIHIFIKINHFWMTRPIRVVDKGLLPLIATSPRSSRHHLDSSNYPK